MDNEYVTEKKVASETLSVTIEVECLNARATEFRVNMGKASFLSREIPVTGEVREAVSYTHLDVYKRQPECRLFG